MNALRTDHLEILARLGISAELLNAASITSVTDKDAREMLGINGHRMANLGGILLTYRSPLTGERVGSRIRLDYPLSDGGKYISEAGCRHLFFAPFPTEWLTDTSIPVVFVESEKAALALQALANRLGRKLIVIAIGGCWGWRRLAGKRPLPNGGSEPETGPSPDFDFISWADRTTILAFDSNASTNPKVRKARRALAHELADRGANVLISGVPAMEGVNGPDDLIAVCGDEAMVLVLDTARSFAECALNEAEQALSEIQVDKKTDPLPVIEAIAAIEDPAHRALLIGRLAALKIPGVNRKFVEQRVGHRRAEAERDRKRATEAARHGRLLAMNVEGAALLDEVCALIQRFVSLVEAEVLVLTLWIMHTHAVNASDCTPYLSITSAEKQSGKSRLLEVLQTLVAKAWYTGRVTAAVLYRKIDAEAPTLLLDESDAAFNSGEEYGEALRGILNTGHRRGGKATCCVGQGVAISYQDFSTFSPKAIAGIGKLPDTVADRSIPIRLKRKARREKVERFRLRKVRPEAERLRERLEAWGAQNVEMLRDANPELPEELSDRQQDGAESLLAIADLAGGKWPEAARRALVSLCCGGQAANDSSGTLLLSDIRQIFKAKDIDRLSSADLASALADIETSPWSEWNHGKPITRNKLARLLRGFEINPHNIRIENRILKGYEVDDFKDAWERYVPLEDGVAGPSDYSETATPPQTNADAVSSSFEAATDTDGVAGQEVAKPSENAPCSSVAASVTCTGTGTGESGTEEEL